MSEQGKVGFTALQWAGKAGDVLEAEKSSTALSATLGSALGLELTLTSAPQ